MLSCAYRQACPGSQLSAGGVAPGTTWKRRLRLTTDYAGTKNKVILEGDRGLGEKEYFVAMPEHLARIFKATRSPRSILRTGPLTVAQ